MQTNFSHGLPPAAALPRGRIMIPLLPRSVAFQAAASSGADTAMLLLVLELSVFVAD